MRSFIPYMGSKSTVADRLVELMPPEVKSFLIAPFFGGVSVEFAAPKGCVTYDDDPEGYIRSLHREEFGWRIQPLPIRYGGGHHATKTNELLITNFETGETE